MQKDTLSKYLDVIFIPLTLKEYDHIKGLIT